MTIIRNLAILLSLVAAVHGAAAPEAEAPRAPQRGQGDNDLVELLVVYFGHLAYPESAGFQVALPGAQDQIAFDRVEEGVYRLRLPQGLQVPDQAMLPRWEVGDTTVAKEIGPITTSLDLGGVLAEPALEDGGSELVGLFAGGSVSMTRGEESTTVILDQGGQQFELTVRPLEKGGDAQAGDAQAGDAQADAGDEPPAPAPAQEEPQAERDEAVR